MITHDQVISIGHYNKPHGVGGEISASLDVEPDVLQRFSCLISDIDGILVPFFIDEWRSRGPGATLLTIDGVHSDVQAATLANKDIMVLRTEFLELSEQDQYDGLPLDFFIGFTVIDDNGHDVGRIVDYDDSTDNVLFIVERDGDTLRLPVVDDWITDIDSERRTIAMTLPDGLLDL